MNDQEYLMLKKMIEKNRRLFKKEIIDYDEYFENHNMLMEKIKDSILLMNNCDISFLAAIDLDDCLEKYRKGIMIVKFNMN
ncbi:MAG: hypothetical protein K0R36_596 [Chryseobacterium sp.]|jgi:hypothetical protein|nr:hypothetical protein [Chryseobacterium sp.]